MAHGTTAHKIETRPRTRGDGVDRTAVLLKVMDVLSVKGFAKASIADLTHATGVNFKMLRTAFGGRDEILRAAIHCCAETEASLAHEALRVSSSGRQAILSMLEENVRLRRHRPGYCGCLFTANAFVVPPDDTGLHEFLTERRRSLSQHIRVRLAQSVADRELSKRSDCEAIAELCFTVLSGLTFRVLEGAPQGPLFRSIDLFVRSLGFASSQRQTGRRHAGSR